MDERYAGIIAGFPLFQGFTVQGVHRLLERGEVREHSTGEVLFREGEPPTYVLLVLNGKIQVFVERERNEMILTSVGPGTILGELAVLCGIPRAASVRATEHTAVLQWDATAFRNLLLRYPLISERIFKQSLRSLIEKERSLIDSLILSRSESKQSE